MVHRVAVDRLLQVSGVFGSTYTQDEPRKLVKTKRFGSVAIGTSCTFAATHAGDLFGWGTGLVNFADDAQVFNEPVPLLPGANVKKVSAGPKHAAFVNTKGEVYSWGKGGDWMRGGGQLGHGDKASHKSPKKIEFFDSYGAKIIDVGCGHQHTLFLTDDGEVLSCGSGEYGRLGLGSTSDESLPTPIDIIDDDVVQIAVGYDHSLLLTSKGQIFSWGRNAQGQLGHADSYVDMTSMENYPRRIENEGLHGDDGISTNKDKEHEDVTFVHIAAGHNRSAAVSKDGHLFIWGSRISHRPKIIDKTYFDNLAVKKVVIGGDSGKSVIAAITEDDSLWTLGDASSKMLGRPGLSGKHVIPERVPVFVGKRVIDVYSGFDQHIFAKVVADE
jgi:alpha-tubulin suppressor-like RCC1 family protein